MAVKRRIPKKGVVRFWVSSDGAHRGVVVRLAKTNAPLRRGYTGMFAPSKLIREPHVLLRTEWKREVWVPLQELMLRKKEADKIVYDGMCMMAHARRMSRVDPIN